MSSDSITGALALADPTDLGGGKWMKRAWCGMTSDGDRVEALELNNGTMGMSLMTYGARLRTLTKGDKELTLSLDNMAAYEVDPAYLGASIGRVTNRIKNAKFLLNDVTYTVTTKAQHALHGGEKPGGWDGKIWAIEKAGLNDDGNLEVEFSRISPTGEMGFPGSVHAKAKYTLDESSLSVVYTSTGIDAATPVNMTNHSYFTFSEGKDNVIQTHGFKLGVENIMDVDEDLIPTGGLTKLGEDFFTEGGKLVKDLNPEGFDNFFMGDNTDMSLMVTVYHPPSGQKLEVWSDQVGFQMFTGPGNGDYFQQGIALEASGAVDATNFPDFPSITLQPGETRTQTTIYKFFG